MSANGERPAWTDRRPVALAFGGLAAGLSVLGSVLTVLAPDGAYQRTGFYATPGPLYSAGVAMFEVDILLLIVVGLLICVRLPENRVGWLLLGLGLLCAMLAATQAYVLVAFAAEPGALPAAEPVAWLVNWTGAPVFALAIAVLFVFPTGRAISRTWAGAFGITLLAFGAAGATYAFSPGPMPLTARIANPFPIAVLDGIPTVVLFASFLLSGWLLALLAAASMIVRYRRGSLVERLQLKWVTFAATLLAIAFIVLGILRNPWDEVGDVLFYAAMATIPIAFAVAILRYRLYAIDVIIRRTLVYGALTACLAAAYGVGVVTFQAALDPITGGESLAIAAATLLVATAFRPIRSRLQDAIDRRFNRLQYDATRTVAGLAARLRDEVELEVIESDVLAAVEDAVQPSRAALWRRQLGPPPERRPRFSP